MSLFKVFDIAGSGMSAQSLRLNTVASNLANLNSASGNPDEVYRARAPIFEAILEGMGGKENAGVRVVDVVESQAELARVYDPGNPQANDEGYVFQTNVNLGAEMVNMISASRGYQNNTEILSTTRDLMLRTLNLGN
ncbi:MAG: flagellar basal body rod protein FlgC [Wenzhouxiangellaceae bacterium]|nr:flagellar basal body rod protein FlgC [Wenzhouxiangellaceae bacterium]